MSISALAVQIACSMTSFLYCFTVAKEKKKKKEKERESAKSTKRWKGLVFETVTNLHSKKMSDGKQSKSSYNESTGKEDFGLTGVTTGSTGEHLATTGASALGTSGGSGDMGNEKSKIDRATGGIGTTTSPANTPTSSTTVGHDGSR